MTSNERPDKCESCGMPNIDKLLYNEEVGKWLCTICYWDKGKGAQRQNEQGK